MIGLLHLLADEDPGNIFVPIHLLSPKFILQWQNRAIEALLSQYGRPVKSCLSHAPYTERNTRWIGLVLTKG